MLYMYRLDAIMFTVYTLKILHTCSFFILLKLNNVTVANNTCDSYCWDNTLYVEYRNVYITNFTVYKNYFFVLLRNNLTFKYILLVILYCDVKA